MAEVLKINLPADTKFIMPIRLFSAGVAQRVGMDIEDIEDFKQAVSEACMIVMAGLHSNSELEVVFSLANTVEVTVCVGGEFSNDFTEQQLDALEISKILLEALCVENVYEKSDDYCKISMVFDIFK